MLLNTFHYFQLFICVAFIELDLPDIVMDIAWQIHFHHRICFSRVQFLFCDEVLSPKVRSQKKIQHFLGIFPNMGGGSSQFPKLL